MTARMRAEPAAPLGVRICLRRDLPVDAPHAVGLGMEEHLAARVPGRVEVEVPLVRERQLGADIGDQEAVVEGVAGEADPERRGEPPNGRHPYRPGTRTVPDGAGIGLEGGGHAGGILGQPGEPCPRWIEPELQRPRLQQLLDLGLADVHERRKVLVVAGQLDVEQLAAAEIRPPDAPLDAAIGHRLPTPRRAQISRVSRCMQIAFEPMRSVGLGLEQVDADAVLGQPPGQRQADRAGPDDRHVRHRRA